MRGRLHRTAATFAAMCAFLCAACGVTAAQQTPAAGGPAFASSGDPGFDAWRADFAQRALAQGRDPAVLARVLDGLTPDQRVIDQDRRQPEFVSPVWDYVNARVSPQRIAAGQNLKATLGPLLPQIAERYGVDTDIVLGVWGLESNFGAALLPHDAARALATLAYEGRRRAAFETYLLALLQMVERGYAAPGDLKSSWAGALGQPQFMPDAYLNLAVDWDGDGKRDIWNNRGDVAASIAHYLQARGWAAGQPVFDEVRLPAGFDFALADAIPRPVSRWADMGVTRVNGTAWSDGDRALSSELFLPAGARGPALLLHPNFTVIRRYNASDRYALSVALLARAFAGQPGLVTPWPTQLGALQRDEILELQTLLNGLGYSSGNPDGQFGSATRRAVAAFQAAEHFAPDGFPTQDLLRAVRARAGVSAPEPAPAATPSADVAPSGPPNAPLDRAGIRALEQRLRALGYTVGAADGEISDQTRRAIRAFERQHSLPETGRATNRVLRAAQRARR